MCTFNHFTSVFSTAVQSVSGDAIFAASNNSKKGGIMSKRFVMAGIMASVILASCNDADPASGESRIRFSFAEPLTTAATRAGSPYDTNSFILTVRNVSGDTVWCGLYGNRPADLAVGAGTYEVSAVSSAYEAPAFNSPQYGDSQIVVASNGEDVNVAFLCKMINSGIKISLTEAFKAKYPSGSLVLRQDGGCIEYGYGESRTAYFKPGNVTFWHKAAGIETALFNRTVAAGEIHSLTINASREDSQSGFTISVDTTSLSIVETITIGEGFAGEDGSTATKALSVSAARERPGDTVWVWGYIVAGDLSTSLANFSGPFTKSSNMAIASTASEKNYAECFSVELSRIAIKSALNLVDNPGNLGRKVFLKGVVSTYFGITGLKSVTDYSW